MSVAHQFLLAVVCLVFMNQGRQLPAFGAEKQSDAAPLKGNHRDFSLEMLTKRFRTAQFGGRHKPPAGIAGKTSVALKTVALLLRALDQTAAFALHRFVGESKLALLRPAGRLRKGVESARARCMCAVSSEGLGTLNWILATDWDDTVKAGGNDQFFGIRGVGRRVKGTYPGMVTLLAELDECGTVDINIDKHSFQVWSANPFSSKIPSSCVPPLHRKPLTCHGSKRAGLAWALSNWVPKRFNGLRDRCLERSVTLLADAKYRTFRKVAQSCGSDATEIIFFGDSAQGDVDLARRMVEDEEHGTRVWAFLHDLTREVVPGRLPVFSDERIIIQQPFSGELRRSDAWTSPRINFYKTIPEAAFMLAQYGFLDRDGLGRVIAAARRECVGCQWAVDTCTIERLKAEGRTSCIYEELVMLDIAKCEALIDCDGFWENEFSSSDLDGFARESALATEEISTPQGVAELLMQRTAQASERARRAGAFREYAEAEWKRQLRA